MTKRIIQEQVSVPPTPWHTKPSSAVSIIASYSKSTFTSVIWFAYDRTLTSRRGGLQEVELQKSVCSYPSNNSDFSGKQYSVRSKLLAVCSTPIIV